MRNFSEGPALSIRQIQKVQREVIYFSCVFKKKKRNRCILSKNCSINGENREIYAPYNFWAPVKSNTSDVWNWNCWTFLVQKLKWGAMAPLALPVATPLYCLNFNEINFTKWNMKRKFRICCGTKLKRKSMEIFFLCFGKLGKLFP